MRPTHSRRPEASPSGARRTGPDRPGHAASAAEQAALSRVMSVFTGGSRGTGALEREETTFKGSQIAVPSRPSH